MKDDVSVESILKLFGVNRQEKYGPFRQIEEIVCLFGVSGGGKSTYIARNYEIGKNADDIIDVYQFQSPDSYPSVSTAPSHRRQGYLSLALLESVVADALDIKESKTGRLVIEGTYMKKARRASLIQTIRNGAHPNAKIKCVWVMDSERADQMMAYDGSHPFDIPTVDEGFDEIVIYEKNEDIIEDEDELARLKRIVDLQKEIDRITESDLLGYRELLRAAGDAAQRSMMDVMSSKSNENSNDNENVAHDAKKNE